MDEERTGDARVAGATGATGDQPRDALTALFEEYLASVDREDPTAHEPLLERAGDAAPELEARIRAHRAIRSAVRGHAPLPPLAALEVPERIGRFEIERFIDEGGLGRVYLAHDPELGRDVALKVLGAGPESDRAMVLNEARSIARLEHPGVVRVFEVGASPEGEYVVMEHLPGPSLLDVIYELRRLRDPADPDRPPGPRPSLARARTLARALLPFSARVECMLRIAEALAYCHDRGVLHRDAKPANVLFSADGTPKLIDFGLAHLDDRQGDSTTMITQRLMGTPAYVAPEQIEQGKTGADPASDQFSFGVVCYELLGLPHPFERAGRTLTLDAIARAMPKPPRKLDPSIPADLERVVMHCLGRAPEDRYPSMEAVADDLRAIVEHRPISVREPSVGHALRLWASRNRQTLGWLAAALVATAALVGSQAAWRAWSARAGVREAAAKLDLSATEVTDLRGALEALAPLQARAATLDADLWARVFGQTEPDVRRATAALGEHAVATLEEKLRARGEYFQFFQWRSFFEAARAAIPGFGERDVVRDFLQLGRVSLNTGGLDGARLRIYARETLRPDDETLMAYAAYRPLDFDCRQLADYDLSPGLYRILAWSRPAEPPRELEFFKAEHTDPPRVLELSSAPRVSWSPPRGAHGRIVTTDGGVLDEEPFPLPPFLFSGYVTVEQFNAFRRARGEAPIEGAASKPAIVSWLDALHYAGWAGARLPTAWELDSVPQAELVRDRPDSVAAEFVSDPAPGMGGSAAYLTYSKSHTLMPLRAALNIGPRDDVPLFHAGSVAFRLVVSAASEEELQAFWRRVEEERGR